MAKAQPKTRIYLAGPMFSAGDKAEQSALVDALDGKSIDGVVFECHAPHINGIEVAAVMQLLNTPGLHDGTMLEPIVLDRCAVWVTRTVVALDVYQSLEGCQYTVLNIDGRVPDEGALVEATLAWYAGHPVIPYKTTTISELGWNNNPMIGVISRWNPVPIPSDLDGIVNAVKEVVKATKNAAAKAAAGSPRAMRAHPPDVQQLVKLGRVISDIRAQPLLDNTSRGDAAKKLKRLPSEQKKLLEPVTKLQDTCLQVVLAIIELSQLDTGDVATRQALVKDEIAKLKEWEKEKGIRDLIVKNPITC